MFHDLNEVKFKRMYRPASFQEIIFTDVMQHNGSIISRLIVKTIMTNSPQIT